PVRFRARMPVQHLPRLAPAQTTPRPRADAAGSLGKVHQPPPALVRALADGAVALGTDPLPAALVVCEPLLGQPLPLRPLGNVRADALPNKILPQTTGVVRLVRHQPPRPQALGTRLFHQRRSPFEVARVPRRHRRRQHEAGLIRRQVHLVPEKRLLPALVPPTRLRVGIARVNADFKLTLPQFWCNLAVGWRNLPDSREPLCDCFAWSFAVCGDFFEVAVWSFGIRSFRQHTLPSPSSVQRPTPHVLRAAASPAAGTAAIPGS